MSQQNMRQSKPQNSAAARVSGRITRGFSDLPKEQPKVESSQSSEEEEQSESAPKTKKIHHMTLKAMERRKKLAEEMQKLGICPQQQKQVEKPPPKKRGRPKGSKKIADREEKQEYQVNEDLGLIEQEEVVSDKKEITLRKRGKTAKMADPASEDIVQQSSILKKIQVEIQLPVNPPAVVAKQPEVAQLAPKKRGRKKKTHPQPQNAVVEQAVPVAKVYTVPKAQTYDNYLKFYDRLMQQAKEGQKQDIPLIFDRFSDPEAYGVFINSLRK